MDVSRSGVVLMSLRVALRIFDERLLRHLSTIISLARQRAVPIQLVGVSDTGDNAPQVIIVCEDIRNV